MPPDAAPLPARSRTPSAVPGPPPGTPPGSAPIGRVVSRVVSRENSQRSLVPDEVMPLGERAAVPMAEGADWSRANSFNLLHPARDEEGEAGHAREAGGHQAEPVAAQPTTRRALFTRVTPPADWHGAHRLALASSRPHENPAAFRMAWPLRHSCLIGAGDFAGKVRFALEHLQSCRPLAAAPGEAGDFQDMRPLMHAGVELALRNSGDRIRATQACALVDELMRQASDPAQPHALQPDALRMVMAGLVAVWDPMVSCEVALHLFAKAGEAPDPALQALAEGLGIGQGWKGMDLIHHSFAQLPEAQRIGGPGVLLKLMDQGQAVGKGWLLRLEQALPGMQGHDPGDGYQHLLAVILLRKHFTPHETPTLERARERPLPVPAQTKADQDEGTEEGDTDTPGTVAVGATDTAGTDPDDTD